jgi:hypothetical protein
MISVHEPVHERLYGLRMGAAEASPAPRRRGNIRAHGSKYQIRVTAGDDPETGERIVLCETAATRREAPGG